MKFYRAMNRFLKSLLALIVIVVIAIAGFIVDAHLRISALETFAADEGAPGRFVTVDGRKLHVATIGDVIADPSGAPLLLIHDFGAPGHIGWLPWASKLATQRALILPDLLGFGHSERVTAPDQALTLKGRAAALAAMLDSMAVPQVDILGESYGGAVAAQFALDYPARVRRIVFLGATIYEPAVDGLGQLPAGIGRALTWHMHGSGPFGTATRSCSGQPSCRALRLARIKGTTDALRVMSSVHRSGADEQALREAVSRIAAPALVVWGSDDRRTPVAQGDKLAQALKSNFAVIAQAGHAPYKAQPDKVAARVLEFLNGPAKPL